MEETFAGELKEIVETAQRNRILSELAEAQRIASEKLFAHDLQKQKVKDIISELKDACIAAANIEERQLSLDLSSFLNPALPVEDDPVYQGVMFFCRDENLRVSYKNSVITVEW